MLPLVDAGSASGTRTGRRYPDRVSLRSLPALLRNEPAMTQVVGVRGATLAVSTPAQAFVLAGLVRLGSRKPVLVVTPTGAAAAQLAHDLEAFATGVDEEDAHRPPLVELFPAWETLPFERISPEVHTMGRRLRLLWALGGGSGAPMPDIVVAPVKAVLQRLGPWRTAARPVVVARGDRVVVDDLVAQLVALGYRRESLVEHRGELAVRGGIVDVFPSTGDEPVRIDLWGDEVDRLTRFDVADQRSTDDLEVVELFGCRELVTDGAMRRRAADLVATDPWGRHQWDRIAHDEQFDGMESWLPWLVDEVELLPDLLGDGPRWSWSSPDGSATGRPSCSTRSRPWPTPWPPPGGSRPEGTHPGCTPRSTAC